MHVRLTNTPDLDKFRSRSFGSLLPPLSGRTGSTDRQARALVLAADGVTGHQCPPGPRSAVMVSDDEEIRNAAGSERALFSALGSSDGVGDEAANSIIVFSFAVNSNSPRSTMAEKQILVARTTQRILFCSLVSLLHEWCRTAWHVVVPLFWSSSPLSFSLPLCLECKNANLGDCRAGEGRREKGDARS
ncbi:hypothetical protein MPTK1_6g08510 [Marchantia polymorpha subsp. ruderalis]|nr:hypothetical protein MARPO_0060s0070 [Marchantia polymorpha]BBN14057.1 hypothetical protein Mp_6g08510 [Marchantia polymorpha subsp. ruderalis]|eukprot:PTQ36988.1 hypothetical protein MARPO_0060s0070 [Marchantia polymorpha]